MAGRSPVQVRHPRPTHYSMPVPIRPPYVGTAAIIIRDDRVLLGKRKNAHTDGDWTCPGGHLEFGESWDDCIRREVKEETGLQAAIISLVKPTNDIFEKEDFHYITLFFEVTCKPGEPRIMEPHKRIVWRWFMWDKLPENCMLPIKNLIATDYRPTGL